VTTAQTETSNSMGEATEQRFDAQDPHTMQMILASDADAGPPAASTDQSGTGGPSVDEAAANLLASIRLRDGQTVVRWFLEQTFKNGREDAYIASRAAVYLRRSQSEHIPDWLMERLEAEARLIRDEPLTAEEEGYLDELEEVCRRNST
jgi:hypothetical protein